MSKKQAKIFAVIGTLFVSALGSLLHFVYEWSGGKFLAALISGVNESTWEHLKLFYIPFLIFTLIEYAIYGKNLSNFFKVKLISALIGMGLTVMLFYTYVGVVGFYIDWLNIAIFYISVIASYIFSYRRLSVNIMDSSPASEKIYALLMFAICALFFIFTFYPPQIGLFRDPVSGTYGVGEAK